MKIELREAEKIVAVVPQYDVGPGWANTPIWVHIVNYATKEWREECIQPEDRTPELNVLFGICVKAHEAMLFAIEPLVFKRKRRRT